MKCRRRCRTSDSVGVGRDSPKILALCSCCCLYTMCYVVDGLLLYVLRCCLLAAKYGSGHGVFSGWMGRNFIKTQWVGHRSLMHLVRSCWSLLFDRMLSSMYLLGNVCPTSVVIHIIINLRYHIHLHHHHHHYHQQPFTELIDLCHGQESWKRKYSLPKLHSLQLNGESSNSGDVYNTRPYTCIELHLVVIDADILVFCFSTVICITQKVLVICIIKIY